MEAVKGDAGSGQSDDDEEEEEEDESEDEESQDEPQDETIIDEPEAAEENQAGPSGVAKSAEDAGMHDTTDISISNSKGEQEGEQEELSDTSLHGRQISRSPPQSRNTSPDSLAKMTESLSIASHHQSGIKEIVSSDLSRQRARQKQKYHSKRGAQRAGRPKGSKAKQDNRVKMDNSGVWG